MSPLKNDQKQLLFDHCIGLTSQEQSRKAKALISENKEAAVLYSKLKAIFKPLESVELESCPDDLVERTILRIDRYADSNTQLTQLLNAEQNKKSPIRIGFLGNFSEIATIAAAIILIAGVLVPSFSYARQRFWKQKCQGQIASFYSGLQGYISDHDGKQPSYPKPNDADWWKIGFEEQSNTSHMYILVRKGYVETDNFVCPSKKRINKGEIDNSKFETYKANCRFYKDFPDRRYINYSFQIRCAETASSRLSCRRVLMADSNPIFENLPDDYSQALLIELKREQLNTNSINHNRSGQNVLSGDGSVKFQKSRLFENDDIFTLQDTDIYEGNETPSCKTDTFLAP